MALAIRLLPALALGGLLGLALFALRSRIGERAGGAPRGLPALGEVPAFSLVERSGAPLTRDALLGRVWVADFVFTRCSVTCPVMTAAMRRLQEDFADLPEVRLVSFTVDPERDTPDVLREYARAVGADRARWLFATGEKAAIHGLSREGFRLGVGDPATGDGAPVGAEAILHSTRLVLVDARARIRGYYDGGDPEAVALLERHARRLAREASR